MARINEAFTVISRFRSRPLRHRQALYSRGKPFQYFAYINETGQITAGVFIRGQEVSATTQSAVQPGHEGTFASTYNISHLRLYLNGHQEAEVSAVGPTDYVAGTVYIGSYFGTSHFFKGTIAETLIYDRALSSEEIAAGEVPEGLVGHWRQPDWTAVRVEDLSGNDRHGTIMREWKVQ
ncbi:MAG: LamG domain-containing protein [Candidatus Zipacnadales bacterium]